MNIRVIGLGNVFMSDDAFGPYVVRVLEAFYEMPDAVRLVDGAVPGLELAPHFEGADAVILVETIPGPERPGHIRVTRWPDGPLNRCPDEPMSRCADEPMTRPMLIKVVPEWIATGVLLSRPVRSAIAPVVALIVAELERLGHPPRLRDLPRPPDTWWERMELETPQSA